MTWARLSLAILIALTASAASNFSGAWTLDRAKSSFGLVPMPDTMVITVEHSEPRMRVTAEQKGGTGDERTQFDYTTDGKECRNEAKGTELLSSARWRDGKLEITTRFKIEGSPVKLFETWTVSADGFTLNVERNVETELGTSKMRMLFRKQQVISSPPPPGR